MANQVWQIHFVWSGTMSGSTSMPFYKELCGILVIESAKILLWGWWQQVGLGYLPSSQADKPVAKCNTIFIRKVWRCRGDTNQQDGGTQRAGSFGLGRKFTATWDHLVRLWASWIPLHQFFWLKLSTTPYQTLLTLTPGARAGYFSFPWILP